MYIREEWFLKSLLSRIKRNMKIVVIFVLFIPSFRIRKSYNLGLASARSCPNEDSLCLCEIG